LSFTVKDIKDRVIISVSDDGQIATARYEDLSEECKDFIIDVYKDLTDEDPVKLRDFLDFKEHGDSFCS